jgi:hypothetical protein
MATFTGTKFNDALSDSGLFDSARSDPMPGIAGNDAPTADAGDRSVELAEHESATRPHADRAMLLHGNFSFLVDTDGKAGTATVVEAELVGRLKADSNEVAVEGVIARDDEMNDPAGFESVTRSHADRAMLLHGDFSSLVDTDAALAAATEELFGNYNFVRIEPTSSVPESVPSMVDGHGNDAKGVGFADGTSNTIVFAERHALSGAEGDDLLPGGGNGNETKIVDIVDGTSNTLAFATNGVVESVNAKYTLFSNGDDDPVAGAARLAHADYGSDGGSVRGGDLSDVGDLLFGLAGNESVTADGGDGFVESTAFAGVTRPHVDGVVTDNKDPDALATVIDDIYDDTGSTFVDGIDRNGNDALGTRGGGEVIGDFSSYVTNGTTGTVSDSGNDARIADITDGTSNTALDASSKDVAYLVNASGGWDPTIGLFEFQRTDEGNGSTTPHVDTDGGGDDRVLSAVTVLINQVNAVAHIDDVPHMGAGSNASAFLPDDFNTFVVDATTGTVSDSGGSAGIAGFTDGTSNTVMFGRTDGNAPSDAVEDVAVKYTMFDGSDVLLLEGNGADRLAHRDDVGNGSVLRDSDVLDIGGGVLDVSDILTGVDAADATTLHADPGGQANGIIAVLIGVSADIPDLLNNGSPTLD